MKKSLALLLCTLLFLTAFAGCDVMEPLLGSVEELSASVKQNNAYMQAVQHDVEGITALYGGCGAMIAKLDQLFEVPPHYRVQGYGFEIHEMTEMALKDWGQMAISNQPSFHLPYLYAALGAQDKTDYYEEKPVREAFSPETDGYPGDEDTGTTSVGYILATLGMYRLCPGKDEWISSRQLVHSYRLRTS